MRLVIFKTSLCKPETGFNLVITHRYVIRKLSMNSKLTPWYDQYTGSHALGNSTCGKRIFQEQCQFIYL